MLSRLLYYQKNQERLCKEFSMNEYLRIYGNFRGQYKEKLNRPNAENNDLINYDLYLRNYMILNSTQFMICAGALTYGVKRFFGYNIDKICFNYLGEKRGYIA